MNISCNVIRDILPLYAEDMVSEDTRKLVDEHLCGCDECTRELGKLKKKDAIPVSVDTAPMEHIRKSIRKRQILTTVCVIMTIASLVWSWYVFITAPIRLPAEKAIEGVELREDGGLAIDIARGYNCVGIGYTGEGDMYVSVEFTRKGWRAGKKAEEKLQGMTQEELDAHIREYYHISEVTQRDYDFFGNVQYMYVFCNEKGDKCIEPTPECTRNSIDENETWTLMEPNYDLWYLDVDGNPEALLWNGGDGEFCGDYLENDISIKIVSAVFYGSLMVMVLAGILVYVLKNSKWKKIPLVIGICAASVAVHTLLYTGANFTDYTGTRMSGWDNDVIVTSLLLTVTACLWLYRYSQNQKASI